MFGKRNHFDKMTMIEDARNDNGMCNSPTDAFSMPSILICHKLRMTFCEAILNHGLSAYVCIDLVSNQLPKCLFSFVTVSIQSKDINLVSTCTKSTHCLFPLLYFFVYFASSKMTIELDG